MRSYSSSISSKNRVERIAEDYNQPNIYSYNQGLNINRDFHIQRSNPHQEYSESISEYIPTNMQSKPLRVDYFHLIHEEDFVEFLQMKNITEEDWYNTTEIDRMTYYSGYDKHIQIQNCQKEAEKKIEIERIEKEKAMEEKERERIEKEKVMEALKVKEQESLKEIEKEREKAEQERKEKEYYK